ncbi:MAG: YgaP family membrane protein [Acidimicrobiales bacterium]
MTKNESTIDRIIRLVLAIVAAVVAIVVGAGSVGGIVLWVVTAILVFTAATGSCLLYRLFGISTCPIAPPEH